MLPIVGGYHEAGRVGGWRLERLVFVTGTGTGKRGCLDRDRLSSRTHAKRGSATACCEGATSAATDCFGNPLPALLSDNCRAPDLHSKLSVAVSSRAADEHAAGVGGNQRCAGNDSAGRICDFAG